MHSTTRILKQEHRALGAVIHGLLFHTREIEEGRTRPHFALLHAMVHYIRQFPEKLHHPKEDALLFARLAAHGGRGAEIVAELEQQHRDGAAALERLDRALSRYETEGGALGDFAQELRRYADFHWDHMTREEQEVLPLAETSLSAEEWREIDAGFEAHSDPLGSVPSDPAAKEFRELFQAILALAPPPLGFGKPV